MNKKIKFLIAICLGFGVGFIFDNNFAFSNSLKIEFHCAINYSQKLHKHFEILSFDSDFKVELETRGYSDIKNAVFFNINSNVGYLNQYNLLGVYYNCIQS